MNPPRQVAKRRMDRAVPFHPRHRHEGASADRDAEVAFTGTVVAGMASMPVAFVHDLKPIRSERGGQTCAYFFGYGHFFDLPSSKPGENT